MKMNLTMPMLVIALIIGVQASAQPPLTINYQAVVRDGQTGLPLSEQAVFLSFEISDGNGGGLYFKENHDDIQTNEFGLVNVQIGGGQSVSGTMAEVPWGDGNLWLTVAVDIGSGLEILQESKFTSVPYALYARDVLNKDDADADPENELITDFEFDPDQSTLHLTEAGVHRQVDLQSLRDDDGDPTNELIDSVYFDAEGRLLTIFEAGNPHGVSLGSNDDADADPTNELLIDATFDPNTYVLTIADNGETYTMDLSDLIDDADSDPTNELVDSLKFDSGVFELYQNQGQRLEVNLAEIAGADTDPTNELLIDVTFDPETSVLTIIDNGDTYTMDLSGLIDDADSDPTNELVDSLKFDSGVFELYQNQGQKLEVNLAEIAGADTDPTNELLTNVNFDPNTYVLTLADSGGTYTLDLSDLIDDADSDPTNELLTNVTFDSNTNELTIADGGDTYTMDLSGLINDADADPTNELVDSLRIDSGNLELYQNQGQKVEVNLAAIAGADTDPSNELLTNVNFDPNTYVLTLADSGGTYTMDLSDLIDDADSDPTNELLTNVTFDSNTYELTIADDGDTYTLDLSDLIDDADSDPTNELLTNVTFDSNTYELTIADDGGTYTMDLSGLIDDADSDPTNELLTNVTFDSNTYELTIADGGDTYTMDLSDLIDDADANPTNELLTNAGFNSATNILTVTDAGQPWPVDLSDLVDDADADPTNELIDDFRYDVGNGTLVIEEGGDVHSLNLSLFLHDNDPANELQVLSLGGNSLSLSDGGGAIDLSKFDQSALPTGEIFIGGGTGQPVPRAVSGDLALNSDGSAKVVGIQDRAVSTTAPSDGDVLVYDAGNQEWVPMEPSSAGVPSNVGYYSIDPADFAEAPEYDSDNDADEGGNLSDHAFLKLFNHNAPFAHLYKKRGTLVAPVHLPHGANVQELKIYIKDNHSSNFTVYLERKDLINESLQGQTMVSISSGLLGSIFGPITGSIVSYSVVRNDRYSYRLRVSGLREMDEEEPDLDEIRHAVFGAVIKYTTN